MPNDKERLILDKYYNKLVELEPNLKDYFNEQEFAPKEMFVCEKYILDGYCEWLFSLILPLAIEFKEIDSGILQKRMLGHLIERLFYYWIEKEELECYRMEYKDI